jgi:hypothetical protein
MAKLVDIAAEDLSPAGNEFRMPQEPICGSACIGLNLEVEQIE